MYITVPLLSIRAFRSKSWRFRYEREVYDELRQPPYLARDVAQVLVSRGYVLARVTTAHPLAQEARAEVTQFIKDATGGREIELETAVDPGMIGGIKIETPGQALDASIRTKLDRYIEGATH